VPSLHKERVSEDSRHVREGPVGVKAAAEGRPAGARGALPPIHVSHVSVAGPGPRAPPRNKMALDESIAIPSKRHASGPQPTQSGSSQFLGSTSGSQSSQPPVDTVSTSTGTNVAVCQKRAKDWHACGSRVAS